MENDPKGKKITRHSTEATWRRLGFREWDLEVIVDNWNSLSEEEKARARILSTELFDSRLANVAKIIKKRLHK